MTKKNALEILRERAENDPELAEAYRLEKQNQAIADRCLQFRRLMNCSQTEMAKLLGTSKSTICRLENCNNIDSLAILIKLI